jgi:hypothetical protein
MNNPLDPLVTRGGRVEPPEVKEIVSCRNPALPAHADAAAIRNSMA